MGVRAVKDRVLRWLGGRWAPVGIAGVALALCLPSIRLPPVVDDHGFRHRMLIEGRGPDDVFHWGDPEGSEGRLVGRSPWWSEPSELHFFRPLSALTHWLDYRSWPDAVWWMRLQGCLLYALLTWVAARAYRALDGGARGSFPARQAATWGLAGLMFAVNEAHGQSLSFVAGRNTFLSALFGLLALRAHHRLDTRGISRLAGPALLALALACGEAALAALGYLAAHALVLDPRPREVRVRSLLPYLVPLVAWAAIYVSGGYGASTPLLYRDLFGDPLGTLAAGVADLPIWISTQLAFPYASPSMVLEPWMVRLASLPLALLLLRCVWPTLRASPIARFHGLGFALSLVPLLATWPQDRVLVLPSFGAFGLLACFLEHTASSARGLSRLARPVFVGLHLVIAPLSFIPSYLLTARVTHAEDRVDAALPSGAAARETGVVIVRAPVVGTLAYAVARRRSHGQPTPAYHHELYAAARGLTVSRPDANTLELVPVGGYCASRVECLGGELSERFFAGREIALTEMRVEIVAVDPRGAPTRVRFHFPSVLEDRARLWLSWTEHGLEPFELPAVGESRTLAPLSALSAFRE